MSIFDDNQLLDDLIVGYCDIFSDEDPDMERWHKRFLLQRDGGIINEREHLFDL
jgi:hypothetical protein